MDEPSDCRFPIRCPACGEKTGHPIDVATQETQLEVAAYCTRCAHLWNQTFNQSPIMLKPKRDRRGTG